MAGTEGNNDTNGGTNGVQDSRRTFLKIGAGVIVGAVVAGAGVAAYESSVIGSNDSSSSSTVSSLTNELDSTQSALSSATSQISTLSSQLTATQGSLSSANSQLAAASSTNSALNSQLTATQSSLDSATAQIATLQSQVASASSVQDVFLWLSTSHATELAAIISVLIPTDSNGPGGTSAGAIYFIDRQLASDYGKNANMFNQGPYIQPGLTTPVTINGVTYSGGTMITVPTQGTQYFYGVLLADFWRYGLDAFETYCNSAYGANFEDLSAADQLKALTDLTNNVPTSFNDIIPSDFFNEVFRMTWCGFLMDPLYGGNQNMVGWDLLGYNGLNMGNFYGEGLTDPQLMVATTPTKLQPASLAQYQHAALGT